MTMAEPRERPPLKEMCAFNPVALCTPDQLAAAGFRDCDCPVRPGASGRIGIVCKLRITSDVER